MLKYLSIDIHIYNRFILRRFLMCYNICKYHTTSGLFSSFSIVPQVAAKLDSISDDECSCSSSFENSAKQAWNRIFHFTLSILRVFYIAGICAALRRIFPDEVFLGMVHLYEERAKYEADF